MYFVGKLRDRTLAYEIQDDLKHQGIEISVEYSQADDSYHLWALQESSVVLAQEIYRVKLGFTKPQEIDPQWIKIKKTPRGPFTYIMLIVCIGIYLLSFSNLGTDLYDLMFIGKTESPFMHEIFRGQIWRLISPIFLHMSFLHILFNMLWFKDLGYVIEYSFGKNFLLLFIALSGIFSNICQYAVNGPQFGGMSGVLYAMLGFLWVYKNLYPNFEFSIPTFDIGMMIGWYFLCLTGLIGPIANTVHGAGFFAGMVAAATTRFRLDKLRLKFIFLSLFFLIFTLLVEGYKLNGRFFILLWNE